MSGLALVLCAAHRDETALAATLRAVAERHRVEHEVHHVAVDLAGWSDEHAERLARAGRERGVALAPGTGPGHCPEAERRPGPEADGGPAPEADDGGHPPAGARPGGDAADARPRRAASHGPAGLLPAPGGGLVAALGPDQPAPGLVLLDDLRACSLAASGASLSWRLLGQAAQAGRDPHLWDLVLQCQPRTLRQLRWANGLLSTLSPQILTSL